MAVSHRAAGEERVTPLELFFDLVFVFAITQVTGLVSRNPTWTGVAQGLIVLALLWWPWTGYAWLTGTVDPEDSVIRLVIFAAMGAMLVASLAVPHVFGDDAMLFVAAYVAVRVAHFSLYVLVARGDRELLGAVARLASSAAPSIALLVVGAAIGGDAQIVIWAAAIVVDSLGAVIRGARGWQLAAGHFAERHGLGVRSARGASLVALGATTVGAPLDAGIVLAALLGLAVACALWWAYFDVVALAAERRLRRAGGSEALAIARDSYSYLHLPMITGIIFFAVGVKKTIAHVGDPLHTVPAVALCGGVALYLLAHVAFRLRNMGTWSVRRVVCAGILIALIPAAVSLPALLTLALVAAVSAGLIAYEAIRYADARERLRRAALSPG